MPTERREEVIAVVSAVVVIILVILVILVSVVVTASFCMWQFWRLWCQHVVELTLAFDKGSSSFSSPGLRGRGSMWHLRHMWRLLYAILVFHAHLDGHIDHLFF